MARRPRRAFAGLVLTAYAVFVLALVLWPNGADINRLNVDLYLFFLHRGVSTRVTPEWYAVALNVVLLAPLTLVAALAVDRVPWWAWAAIGVLAAVLVELAQATMMGNRVPSWSDVAANATGAVGGALLGRLVRGREARATAG